MHLCLRTNRKREELHVTLPSTVILKSKRLTNASFFVFDGKDDGR